MNSNHDALFVQLVAAAGPALGGLMVDVIDTAKGLKYGAAANDLDVCDDYLFNAAVAIVLATKGEVSSDG